MRIAYWIRVVTISQEMLVIVLGMSAWVAFQEPISKWASLISVDGALKEYIVFLPIALFTWAATEGRQVLHAEGDSAKLLVAWPDYWKLRAHVCVSLFFGFFFATASIVPWMFGVPLAKGIGLLVFLTTSIGALVVCTSLYFARIRIREALLRFATETEEGRC
jgi:hypothetical protein